MIDYYDMYKQCSCFCSTYFKIVRLQEKMKKICLAYLFLKKKIEEKLFFEQVIRWDILSNIPQKVIAKKNKFRYNNKIHDF